IHLTGNGPLRVSTRAPIFRSSTRTSPPGVRMRVPRRKQWWGCVPPRGGGPPQPVQPFALARLEIDARMGRLIAPLAATFPARPAEISRKCLRVGSDVANLHLQTKPPLRPGTIKYTQCEVAALEKIKSHNGRRI